MKQNRNKGMAFISVVIAIMFIGLLATSLTYMAYSNYISKSTRWQSAEHFYYDEYALDELASALRQKGTEQSSLRCSAPLPEGATPLDPTKVLIEEMAKAAGVTTDNGDYNSSATGTWNATNMTNLVRAYGMTNNSNIEVTVNVSTIPGRTTADYVRNKKDIKFCNVQITILDKRNDYKTVITTDIHIPAEPKGGSIPVNEFSLMTDSPYTWDKGGMVIFQGNLFCMDKASKPHNGAGMTVDRGTNLTVAGKQSLIVGDVYVEGNSIVSFGGETTITGTVHIAEGSTVEFRGDNVRIGGIDNSGLVTGYYEVDSELPGRADSVFDGTGTYSAGLASAIMDDVTVIMSGTNASDIKTVTFCKTSDEHPTVGLDNTTDPDNWVVSHPNGSLAAVTSMNSGSMPKESNRTSSAETHLRPGSDDITSAHDTLLFMTSSPNNIRGDYSNSTLICTATVPMQSDDASTAPFITKLNNAAYNDCLRSWAKDISLPTVNGDGSWSTSFNTGKTKVPGKTYEELLLNDPGSGYIKMPMTHLGKEDRWMLFDLSEKKPCIPWGYFIRDDADDVIGFAFTNVRDGDSGGSEMKIRYENWVKE